jgi:hypothetical protein
VVAQVAPVDVDATGIAQLIVEDKGHGGQFPLRRATAARIQKSNLAAILKLDRAVDVIGLVEAVARDHQAEAQHRRRR